MKRLVAFIPVLALVSACPSFTTMGTARTIEKGKGQFYVAAGGISLTSFSTDSSGNPESIGLPSFELGGRYGVKDGVEVGGKIFPIGAELNAKFAVVRPETPGGINVSVGPAVSAYPFTSGDNSFILAWLHLPVLFGFNVGGSELVLAPRVSDLIVASGGDSINTVFAGGSLGFAWKVSDGFRILPEISLATPVAYLVKSGSSTTADQINPEGAIVQFNVGFLMGGD
jgi:hypothetical protein